MADHQPRFFLVCYDIADPRRLVRVHRHLKRIAVPVQYSVFVFHGAPADLRRLFQTLGQLIEPASDDVRAYTLPARPRIVTLGRQILPLDIALMAANGELTPLTGRSA